jgi:hypothetical protein
MKLERVPIDSLRPHPHNYRHHPASQVSEIVSSLEQYGQYRALVISQDDVILAGEGVWRGLTAKGETEAEVCRMPFAHTDPRAEKLLVLDNTVTRLAEDDDDQLAALLRELQNGDVGLAGTGYDEDALQALLGDLGSAEFGGTEDKQTLPDMASKWLVAFVGDEETKRAADDLVAARAQPGEQPAATISRLFRELVVDKC